MFWSATGGGVRRYLLTKHAWLEKQPGWRHTIAVPVRPATSAAGAEAVAAAGLATLPSLPFPGSGGYRLPLRRRAMGRVIAGLQPDIVEAGDPYRVAWAALDAARTRRIPAVAFCHSNLELMARMAAGQRFANAAASLARRYSRHLYERFDLVLAPSRNMQRHLLDCGLTRVAVQPLGVDTAMFHPSRASAAWRSAHGLDADARVLVYAGRFAAEKHLEVLVDAVERLGPPYVLVAIGAGPCPPATSARVRVIAFMSDTLALARALASADAFVHAGDQETFGLSAIEAMACGTPIAVRDAEGLAELVDGRCGIVVSRGSGAAFAEAIAALLATSLPDRRQAARARAEASDWARVLPGLLVHYQGLLGHASPAAAPGATFTAAHAPPQP